MKHDRQPRQSRQTRTEKRGFQPVPLPTDALLDVGPRARGTFEFKPKNDSQRRAHAKVMANDLTFLLGPAGTGKTHIGAAPAALALRDKLVERIIVTRPNVEAGTPMGFLKGTMEEKFAPYFAPVRKILEKVLGKANVEAYLGNGKIEIAPVPFLQGHTFDDAFVLLDEAENMSPLEMEMFLTRIGENTKVVVSGDTRQKQGNQQDGLADAVRRMAGAPAVAIHTFTIDDIVRSGMVREVILRYRKPVNDNQPHHPAVPDFLRYGAS
jgi:phosphate starvation-inducible PhoH-like protein